ncbi:laminin subunit alpha-like, partial [Dendronephthya gigantea]|uniref:laminin subunit alpha-like n=1 Tax=Dendronephthya gigantea TaxID=151771 RepID=UPI00106B255E
MSFAFTKFMLSTKMRFAHMRFALSFCALLACFQASVAQLRQDTINIAQHKTIRASATCGYDLPPGTTEELYCKLATVPGKFGIDGLECSTCNPNVRARDHRIQYAIDGSEKWWQSPPLSRGLQYNEINITIDLGQVFHVVYIVIKTANSPRPGTWVLERSTDFGQTYKAWYYFAPSRFECLDLFKINTRLPLVEDDQVMCTTKYSQIPPFENGEMYISLVNGRPSALRNQVTQKLQDWMQATNVRLRLLRAKTLYGEYLPLAKGDPTVTRRYFYSIKDITIGGMCVCNGYSDRCVHGPSEERTSCVCQKNTCGPSCSECCPGFNQYKWKSGFDGGEGCEACNCFGHSSKCEYNELVEAANRSINLDGEYRGGGVCIDCQDNTFGNNCQFCKHKFYNPTGVPMTSKNACVPCNCDEKFSTGECQNGDGQCKCKPNYTGKKCDRCSAGYYDFPDCKPCQCNAAGTKDGQCEANGDQCPCKDNYSGPKCDRCARGFYNFPQCVECDCDERGSYTDVCAVGNGQCPCLPNFKGRRCDQCADGYYEYPRCRACSCDVNGVTDEVCHKDSSACICKPGYNGTRCDVCAIGYYGYPNCQACQCFGTGSTGPECDGSGRCSCKPQYAGFKCQRCAVGYYDYPRCLPCACNRQGSFGDNCDPNDGQCQCRENFSGTFCNRCKPGFYGFPDCQECGCDPAGVRPLPGRPLGDCSSSNTGQCDCKRFVQGQDCSECRPKTFNLQASNPYGCEECRCNVAGVIGGIEVCDEQTGRCLCKERVASKRCEICKDGFYALRQSNAFGCSGCNCDVGGSYSQICGKFTGQCKCRPNVGGLTCDRPFPKYYHPNLYQLLSEIEDGRTPENTSVRFRYSEQEFPGYSWRGYGVFSKIQRSVIAQVNAKWPENYHIVFHYVLNDTSDATGEVVVRHVSGNKGVTQRSRVTFKPTVNGSHVTSGFVVVAENGSSTQFAMLDGKYDIQFTTDSHKLLLDYVSIVPVFYPGPDQTEGVSEKRSETVLAEPVTRACEVNGENELDDLCVQYSFVGLNKPGFVRIQAEEGYTYDRVAMKEKSTQVFSDQEILKELDFSALALLDKNQSRMSVKTRVPESGKYVVLVQYFTTHPRTQFLDLYVRAREQSFARFRLPSCKYTFGCRTVGLTVHGAVQPIDMKANVDYVLTALTSPSGNVAVDSFILIPYKDWVTDYIIPSKLCVTRMKVCTRTSYGMPGDAVMVEAGDEQSTIKPPNIFDPSASLVYLEGKGSFDKEGFVPRTGDYAVIVHYYQPYHTTVESDTTVSSVATGRGKTSFKYCPNTSGCRAVVKRLDGGDTFRLGNRVAVNFKLPKDNQLWIDYILFVPKDSYSPVLVSGEPVDRTNDFVEHCSKNDLHVTKDEKSFCTQSVFSLTTYHNNGSFPCECDTRGSRSDTCDVFGGQCPCFENIIGRTCSRCKTGYYGFPNCRKCDCENCDHLTGLCECPPNTAGDDCTCIKGTFGYDPVQGCLQCDCDATGVVDAGDSCDMTSGQCSCKPNRAGRRCDQCKPGYYGYPDCRKCDCHEDGITGCDSETGRCICKEHVAGRRCDLCKLGYFYLSGDNPKGCLECWCSGQTNQCYAVDSSNAVYSTGVILADWVLQKSIDSAFYWVLEFGDLTSAHGRNLLLQLGKNVSRTAPLAIIESNGERIFHKDSVSTLGSRPSEISLTATDWIKSDGSSLSRDEFMRMLVQVDLLHVLADENQLLSLQLPVMKPLVVSQVEKCVCPQNTTGLSCQNCNAGYYRSGEACVPCECNGHSSKCNPKTGECYECQDNTAGPKCDKCVEGFYGDPTTGEADACQRCPCPNSSKNYATSCFQELDGSFNCTCREGYTGKLCDECADGYYGDPLTTGCKPCECNNNIDLAATGNCDRRTGECLRCVNNTGGERCEKCQPGYYGNGILHNCRRCDCDECGSASSICNDVTGECSCKTGVVGQRCTACQASKWDFNSCNGCQDCGCSAASLNDDCDLTTGQCVCKPGVSGLKCDRCKEGYFGYSEEGCKACNCPTGQVCDINDGRCCEANDPTCQICPPYHIRTADGCEYCGPCEERLFKRVDRMLGNYSTSGGDGVATDESRKRLNKIEIDIKNLTVRVDNYNKSISNLIDLADGKDKDSGEVIIGSGDPTAAPKPAGKPLENDAKDVIDESMNIVDKANDVNKLSDVVKKNATKTKEDAYDIEEKLRQLLKEIQGCPAATSFCPSQPEESCTEDSQCSIGSICCQLSECRPTKICMEPTIDAERVLQEMRNGNLNSVNILKKIHEIRLIVEGRNYSELRALVEEELRESFSAQRRSNFYLLESVMLHGEVLSNKGQFNSLEPIFRNQLKKAAASVLDSRIAQEINKKALKYQPDAVILKAKSQKRVADLKLKDALNVLEEAKDILKNIKYPNTTGNTSSLVKYLKEFDKRISDTKKDNAFLEVLVNNATAHANYLKETSDFLQSLLKDPNKYAQKALEASNAYDNIVQAIEEILKIAKEANKNSQDALRKSKATTESRNTSVILDGDAEDQKKRIPGLTNWLKRLEDLIKKIRDNFRNANNTLKEVVAPFPEFDDLTSKLGGRTKKVETDAKTSKTDSDDAKSVVDSITVPGIEPLEEGYENALELIDRIRNLTEQNDGFIEELSETINRVKINQSLTEDEIETEVVERIRRIRFNIERGRDRIRTYPSSRGEYSNNTSVELRIPRAAYGPSSQTSVSFNLATDQDNALLLFLGNAKEYLAFEVDDGNLKIVSRNSKGVQTVDTNLDVKKRPVEAVTPGDTSRDPIGWRTVQFERTGPNVMVSVGDSGNETGSLPSQFNVDADDSYLFVGSPPEGFQIPDELKSTTLVGGFDKLFIDGRQVGLYDALNYNTTIAPTGLRPKPPSAVTDDDKWFQFRGNDYQGWTISPAISGSDVTLDIRTAATDGVIYFNELYSLDERRKSYLILEMINGTIGFRFKIRDDDVVSRYTSGRFDDNAKHKVTLKIETGTITLKVDEGNELSADGISYEGYARFYTAFLGGISREARYYNIIKTPFFIGCIMEPNGFREALDSLVVERGCRGKLVSTAEFSGGDSSLELAQSVELSPDSQISSMIKTAEDGVIMNMEGKDGDFVSITTENGNIKIDGNLGGLLFGNLDETRRRRSVDGSKLNDNKWHTVSLRIKERRLDVLVDNKVVFSKNLTAKALASLSK